MDMCLQVLIAALDWQSPKIPGPSHLKRDLGKQVTDEVGDLKKAHFLVDR